MVNIELLDEYSRREAEECGVLDALRDDGCYCVNCGRYFTDAPLFGVYDDDDGTLVETFRGCPECLTDEYLADIKGPNAHGFVFEDMVTEAIQNRMIAPASPRDLFSGKICFRCGSPLFRELESDIDYPYYCPVCDENMYEFEARDP